MMHGTTNIKFVMVYLSTWNLSLVTVDLPSFLGCFCYVLCSSETSWVDGLGFIS